MKLSEMNEEQRAAHHKHIAEQMFNLTQHALDSCDGFQDYVDYMGFVMDEVAHVFMEGLNPPKDEMKKFTVNSVRYKFEISELPKEEEANEQ